MFKEVATNTTKRKRKKCKKIISSAWFSFTSENEVFITIYDGLKTRKEFLTDLFELLKGTKRKGSRNLKSVV